MNKYFRWAILFPSFWLIYHVFLIGYDGLEKIPFAGSGFSYLAQLGALSDFKMYRNLLYAAYCAILFGLMIYKIISARTTVFTEFTRQIIIAMIITTFAYAIAGIVMDIIVLFR